MMGNMSLWQRILLLFVLFWLPLPNDSHGEEDRHGVFAGILMPLKNFFWEDVELYAGFYIVTIAGEETWGGEARVGYRVFENTLLAETVGFYGDTNTQLKVGIGGEYRDLETLSFFFPFELQQENVILGKRLGSEMFAPYASLSTRGSFSREKRRVATGTPLAENDRPPQGAMPTSPPRPPQDQPSQPAPAPEPEAQPQPDSDPPPPIIPG
jgi:hypothetical protein